MRLESEGQRDILNLPIMHFFFKIFSALRVRGSAVREVGQGQPIHGQTHIHAQGGVGGFRSDPPPPPKPAKNV